LKKIESKWTAPLRPGDVAWVNGKGANHLLRAGLVALPEQLPEPTPAPGLLTVIDVPLIRDPAPVVETEAPKSAGERTDGPQTDLPLSSASGPVTP
jgi:hypothetical protein